MLITMPLMVFMMVSADWIIQLLLGDQWSESSRIFIWLGIAGLLQPIANSTGWLFVSQGRAHHQFRWGLIGASTAIVSFLIGLPWGATGVAISYSLIWLFVCMPLLFWFVGRTGPVKAKDFYFSAAPFVLAVLCSAAIEVMLRQGLAITNPLIGCSLNFVVTLITFPLALAILPVGRLALLDCYNLAVKRQFS